MNHVLSPQAWPKYDQLMPIINFFDKFFSKKQLRVWFNGTSSFIKGFGSTNTLTVGLILFTFYVMEISH